MSRWSTKDYGMAAAVVGWVGSGYMVALMILPATIVAATLAVSVVLGLLLVAIHKS